MAYYDDADASRTSLLGTLDAMVSGGRISSTDREPVSYTHLTLPTMLLV